MLFISQSRRWHQRRRALSTLARALSSSVAQEKRQYISFYKYVCLQEVQQVQTILQRTWDKEFNIHGRVYVAKEGINAQICLPASKVDAFSASLAKLFPEQNTPFADVFLNFGDVLDPENEKAFESLQVKVRPVIVQDGIDRELNMEDRGEELTPEEWHQRIERGQAQVLDCRNHYEHEIGRFKGAERIMVDTFRDTFPVLDMKLAESKKDSDLMIYCTGGIRCEKVGAYLKTRGFSNVYRLKGGIVNYVEYLKKSPHIESAFKGKNFVFDERLQRNSSQQVSEDVLGLCFQCNEPCDQHTNCANVMCGCLIIQCAQCAAKYAGTCSSRCRHALRDMESKTESEKKAYRKIHTKGFKITNPNSPRSLRAQHRNFHLGQEAASGTQREDTLSLESLDYALRYSSATDLDPVLQAIRTDAIASMPRAHMLIEEDQVNFLRLLLQASQGKDVLELGCFTGYSAMVFADAVSPDGHVTTCDIDESCVRTARSNFTRHPVGSRITVHQVTGLELLLKEAAAGTQFDWIFVDANKRQYLEYFHLILDNNLLRPSGLLLFDNTLFKNRPAAVERCVHSPKESIAVSLHAFNSAVAFDSRVTATLLPCWDGLTIVRLNPSSR